MKRYLAIASTILATTLAGCAGDPGRTGPFVDNVAPAPFLTHPRSYPTQSQAQAAIELAIQQNGYRVIFPTFSAVLVEQIPTHFAMFACRPGFYRPSIDAMTRYPGTVTCHIDVMDQRYKLLGRATMSFADGRAGWRLASERDREVGAR